MVDPYAIVRRLTGHELISPKDARPLTEAVDGLIDEIGSKDARIAELEAENERLRRLVMAQSRAIHSPEALSRTGVVKVKALEWEEITRARSNEDPSREVVGWEASEAVSASYYTVELTGGGASMTDPDYDEKHYDDPDVAKAAAQADFERRILSALEPAAPEGQQEPVAYVDLRILGSIAMGRDAVDCTLYAKPHKAALADIPLYTRPSEQAVTEAMVEAAVQAVRQYTRDTLFIDEHRELVRTALKAAMEAGR